MALGDQDVTEVEMVPGEIPAGCDGWVWNAGTRRLEWVGPDGRHTLWLPPHLVDPGSRWAKVVGGSS